MILGEEFVLETFSLFCLKTVIVSHTFQNSEDHKTTILHLLSLAVERDILLWTNINSKCSKSKCSRMYLKDRTKKTKLRGLSPQANYTDKTK
jgi:hypothetical protein